ncbi:S-4TM family putative pore-forming effector [Pseudoxanthomonas sp.]|jgi:hypothetical protein|uniref:S-4TM family putative pore-forming effector n=1 Tax=Pseudoxanthomonas sp. TaxID=1871049 RepID=UPI0028C492DD|nr:S-4TM family putative pore-forming effector [Pseudoxanthomonas sp.]
MSISNESAINAIGERQNADGMINLLRARKRIYGQVKLVQGAYFTFIFFLPIISLVVAFQLQAAKPWISLLALVVGAIDSMFIDSWRKRRIKTAARTQEQFDCHVLDLPWNQFTAGKRVSAEEVSKFANPKLPEPDELRLKDWYPANSRNLPPHLARLVCQRTNLWYDSQLRDTYRIALCGLAVVYFLSLLAFASNFTVIQFILVALVPFGPFFTWIVREYHRQNDTIKVVERLLSEIDNSLEKFTEAQDVADAQGRSRELQDAIFSHRANSPLVSDLVYRFKRPALEAQMQAGAEAFVDRVRRSMGAAA